jgi:hypothetical protein
VKLHWRFCDIRDSPYKTAKVSGEAATTLIGPIFSTAPVNCFDSISDPRGDGVQFMSWYANTLYPCIVVPLDSDRRSSVIVADGEFVGRLYVEAHPTSHSRPAIAITDFKSTPHLET